MEELVMMLIASPFICFLVALCEVEKQRANAVSQRQMHEDFDARKQQAGEGE